MSVSKSRQFFSWLVIGMVASTLSLAVGAGLLQLPQRGSGGDLSQAATRGAPLGEIPHLPRRRAGLYNFDVVLSEGKQVSTIVFAKNTHWVAKVSNVGIWGENPPRRSCGIYLGSGGRASFPPGIVGNASSAIAEGTEDLSAKCADSEPDGLLHLELKTDGSGVSEDNFLVQVERGAPSLIFQNVSAFRVLVEVETVAGQDDRPSCDLSVGSQPGAAEARIPRRSTALVEGVGYLYGWCEDPRMDASLHVYTELLP